MHHCRYCQLSGRGWTLGIAADQIKAELQKPTCRTCRTDVHNVAVGHKNAIELLFGFGVACKVDSSVGEEEKKGCNTHNVELDTLVFFPLPSEKQGFQLHSGLLMTTSSSKDTEFWLFFPPFTLQCHNLT